MDRSGIIRQLEDNHKGTWCPYKQVLCQEGYCSECQVFLDVRGEEKQGGILGTKGNFAHRPDATTLSLNDRNMPWGGI